MRCLLAIFLGFVWVTIAWAQESSSTNSTTLDLFGIESNEKSKEDAFLEDYADKINTNLFENQNAEFLWNVGNRYLRKGEYSTAEKIYFYALKKDPANFETLLNLGTIYIFMERHREAVVLFNKILEEVPENASVHNNLAWIYSSNNELRNGNRAVYHAREALLSSPDQPAIWNTLAEAYYVSGDYGRSMRASVEAIMRLKLTDAAEEETIVFQKQQDKIRRSAEALKLMQKGHGE